MANESQSTEVRSNLFHNTRLYSQFCCHLNTEPLIYTPSYKYLGINLTSTLLWSFHIQQAIASANKALGYLAQNLNEVHLFELMVKLSR